MKRSIVSLLVILSCLSLGISSGYSASTTAYSASTTAYSTSTTAHSASTTNSYQDLFAEILSTVDNHFYNGKPIPEQYISSQKELRPRIERLLYSHDQAAFSTIINNLLGILRTSHTVYLSPHDREYYHLAAVFSFRPAIKQLFNNQKIRYPTVGLITERIEGKIFAASVLPGGIADKAGILMGDQIVAVDGRPYQAIDSLVSSIGEKVAFTIQRQKDGPRQTIMMSPVRQNPKEEFLEAERASIRLIPAHGKQIGYIHIYSYAGEVYHQELISALSWGALKTCDAVIIDLRYGMGGADPGYLNLFNRKVPVITSRDRSGKMSQYDPQLRKPTVYLVNHRTRSGKEILAFGAQQYQLATVVGERTAGAVSAGQLFPLSNGDLLYLSVRMPFIDGVSLEGKGVTPDIIVPQDIRYCRGYDAQIARAADFLGRKLTS